MKLRLRTSIYISIFYLLVLGSSIFLSLTKNQESSIDNYRTLIFVITSILIIIIGIIAMNEIMHIVGLSWKRKIYWAYQTLFIAIAFTNSFLDYFYVFNHPHRTSEMVLSVLYSVEGLIYIIFWMLAIFLWRKHQISYAVTIIASLLGVGIISMLYIFFNEKLDWTYTVFVLMIPVLTDVFAFFIGCKYGKNKILPSISPKKTWEGSIGGLIVTVVTVAVFYLIREIFAGNGENSNIYSEFWGISGISYHNSAGVNHLLLGLLVVIVLTTVLSIISQIGDFVFSWIKRLHSKKDFANYLPGHGGICDRIDSLTFVAIAASVFIGLLGM
ncbi:hypothetical protein ASO20_02690 [Mycoplasma sp. (ex Biomphalaria glabrata)]|uniref:phosphatidate cytidylyltransferase n=1 Tax=Mycoplasma sp. (ex Biomphalaria glabrata) TaxID=1749074 RepID=UPI00073ABC39|nr:phosphatidate cytidylyltransferase [Mycoplasma sp. (ex Biomphalaria glabrata)]ALV23542.1 hypothetical protein ASO20_02690 [Mycoplasma sp. (ex Biomphalaria glabrata)]